jgi:hypothetical protein
VLLDLCSGTALITLRPRLRDFVARSSTCARGLPRSLSDHGSRTSSLALRPVLRDCLDHSSTCARGLPRSLSNHGLGTLLLALRPVLRDCLDHSPTMAKGLCVSTTCDWRLAYSWDILSHLDLDTRLIPRLPASSGTTSV